MRLFQFPYSPYALKVRKCLQLKALPFETVDVPYLDRRELLALTGGGMHLPVLQDGERVIPGSCDITRYLDERYPPSLRPGPLAGPAAVFEQWAEGELEEVAFRLAAPSIEEGIAAWNGGREDARAFWRPIKERRYGVGCIDQWRAGSAALKSDLDELLAPLAATLALQPYLLGERPTLADAAVWGQVEMVELSTGREGLGLLPGMAGWYSRMSQV